MILFLQTDAATKATEKAADAADASLSIMDLITNSGTSGILIIAILGLLLFIAVYIFLERLFTVKAATKIDANFMNQLKSHISAGNLEAAKIQCAQSKSPVARLIEKGISRIGKPLDDINKAIENAGRLEVYKLEKGVSSLATIAGAAPMIGFLGTVVGMILAFHQMASGGGSIDIAALAGGIYTAMTTTVAGLVVGIIAYIAYNYIVVKTDKVVHTMEAKVVEFLDLLNEPV